MTRDQWKQYARDQRGPRFYERVISLHMGLPGIIRKTHARSLNCCRTSRMTAIKSAPVLRPAIMKTVREQIEFARCIRTTEMGGHIA